MSGPLLRQILLLHQFLALVTLALLVAKNLMVVLAKESAETNPPLNVGLELEISGSETGGSEQLVHFLEGFPLSLWNEEVDPSYTDAGDGAEEDEGAPGRFAEEGRGGDTDS